MRSVWIFDVVEDWSVRVTNFPNHTGVQANQFPIPLITPSPY